MADKKKSIKLSDKELEDKELDELQIKLGFTQQHRADWRVQPLTGQVRPIHYHGWEH